MARRNQNLAGLAALGALGYALRNRAPVEDRVGVPVSQDDRDFAAMDASMATMRPQRGNQISEEIVAEDGTLSPLRRNLETGDLYNPSGISAPTGGRGAAPATAPVRRAPAPRAAAPAPAAPRTMTRDEMIAQIPTSGYRRVEGGERIDSSELGRNIQNTLNAPVPGFVPLGRAYKGATSAQSAGRALATRGAEEVPLTFLGKSGARAMGEAAPQAGRLESSAARQLTSEPSKLTSEPGKLTGPSKRSLVERDRAARAAKREAEKEEFNRRGVDRYIDSTFEGGMKRGGKVKPKKMASGGVTRSSASKRADGIATKGKTKGKIY